MLGAGYRVVNKMQPSRINKSYLVVFRDTVLLDGFSQVDGDSILELLYEVSEDCAAATQHLGNVQQLADLCLRFHQRLLS